ncbi:MAG: hypothetical protein EON59_10400 [Alphaproteobacteria bacterium]|nr:MAG: hypothetical protein EON59_10400 [Alphaproteobacteria bacterium]
MPEVGEVQNDEMRQMVENHWRNLIRLAGVNPQMAVEEVFRFEAIIGQLAGQLPLSQEAEFRRSIQSLRGEYADWERTNPDTLRTSLNVTGGGRGTETAWLANLETPASVDLKEEQDAFWRALLVNGIPNPKTFQSQWMAFLGGLQAKIAHLSQPEQDGIMTRVVLRNAQYIALAKDDRDALRAELGVPRSAELHSTTQLVVDTAVRATVWQGISALFRAFR